MAKGDSVKRKIVRAGGWQVARRAARSVPFGGTVLAVVLVGTDVRKKGLLLGLINSGIDAIPIVGLAKNSIELFRGDLLPDKADRKKRK